MNKINLRRFEHFFHSHIRELIAEVKEARLIKEKIITIKPKWPSDIEVDNVFKKECKKNFLAESETESALYSMRATFYFIKHFSNKNEQRNIVYKKNKK